VGTKDNDDDDNDDDDDDNDDDDDDDNAITMSLEARTHGGGERRAAHVAAMNIEILMITSFNQKWIFGHPELWYQIIICKLAIVYIKYLIVANV